VTSKEGDSLAIDRDIREDVEVSVVFPCLDEAESVGSCVRQALAALEDAGLSGEVIVVDNGSTDGSPEIAAGSGASVVHERRRGYGRALRTGFACARGETIVMADADCTYPLDRLGELVAPLHAGEADMMYGGRLEVASRKTMPMLHRWFGTPFLTFLYARACGGLPVRDSQSGFRAFRRSTILDLDLQSPGMELNAEMLIKGKRAGLRMKEVPTGYHPRVGDSKLRTFADGWRNLRTVLLLAPDVLLVWPGALLAALGLLANLAVFISPNGFPVGSLRWQPVFFSSIAIVVGVQAFVAGAVIAHRSAATTGAVHDRFAFVLTPGFLRACVVGGAAAAVAGFVLDLGLLVNWQQGNPPPARGVAIGGLGQSLIITGVVVASYGIIARLIKAGRRVDDDPALAEVGAEIQPAVATITV
jgi:glycosyltransferase involved in cell wall biosynthesis